MMSIGLFISLMQMVLSKFCNVKDIIVTEKAIKYHKKTTSDKCEFTEVGNDSNNNTRKNIGGNARQGGGIGCETGRGTAYIL